MKSGDLVAISDTTPGLMFWRGRQHLQPFLIIRAIDLSRQQEISWYTQQGFIVDRRGVLQDVMPEHCVKVMNNKGNFMFCPTQTLKIVE
tara:strand:+ start:570 stop:836 length:267 start_codon:yes stop_codon:yes gene_type:complete